MDRFDGYGRPVLRMLDKTAEEAVKLWDLLNMKIQPTVIRDNAVLIGDAAHPFLPRESPDPSPLPMEST